MTSAASPMTPQSPEQALAAYQRGHWIEAERACRSILELKPHEVRALYLLAVIAAQTERKQEALVLLSRASSVDPASAAAHCNLGDVFQNLDRRSEALQSYDHALRIDANHLASLHRRGNVLFRLDRLEEALQSYDRALALSPDFADALNSRGIVLSALGRASEALASHDRVLAIGPEDIVALNNRGGALRELGRHKEAADSYRRALDVKPDDPDTLYNLGGALTALKRLPEALQAYDQVLALRPHDPRALNNRGSVLRELKRPAEALPSYERSLALRPDHAETLYNRAVALSDLQRHGEAIEAYESAIQSNPEDAHAHFNLALCRLLMGDFARGWPGYEWRWKDTKRASRRREFREPLWLGHDSLAGKTILLDSEQGLGDTLLFCRYVPRVAALGARVVFEVPPALAPLLSTLDGAPHVVPQGDPLPRFDYQCPLGSLPLAFKTTLDAIANDVPYLRSDRDRLVRWEKRLGKASRPRIGIAWSGSTENTLDHNRSLALAQLCPLLVESMQWVSLQRDVRAIDTDLLAATGITHFGDELNDFADTAALVELMDLVITVDTSVAHLAGAMGKTVWMLLAFNADWRWLLGREDSVWYPTARLFRQPAVDDWTSVIDRMRDELVRHLGVGASGRFVGSGIRRD